MAVNTAAAIGMIYAPGRGLRWMTRSGLMQQWKRNDSGTVYRSDAGWPTVWWAKFASIDTIYSRVTGLGLMVSNDLQFNSPASDAYPVRVAIDSYRMAGGTITTTFDKPASQANATTPVPEQFWQNPFSTMGAYRHDVTVSAQNSAQTVERLLFKIEILDGGKGN